MPKTALGWIMFALGLLLAVGNTLAAAAVLASAAPYLSVVMAVLAAVATFLSPYLERQRRPGGES